MREDGGKNRKSNYRNNKAKYQKKGEWREFKLFPGRRKEKKTTKQTV